MDLPTLIRRTSPFPILGVLDGIFHTFCICPNFNRKFCKADKTTDSAAYDLGLRQCD